MIDMDSETLVALRDVPALLPNRDGKPLCCETIRQWAREGRCGVVLETIWIGGSKMTSQEAVKRFCERVTRAKQPCEFLPGSPDPRWQKAIEKSRQSIREQFGI